MVDKHELLKMARNYLNNVTKEQLKKDIEECWVEAGPPLCNYNYIRDTRSGNKIQERLTEIFNELKKTPYGQFIPSIKIALIENEQIKISACSPDNTIYLDRNHFMKNSTITVAYSIAHEILHIVTHDMVICDKIYSELSFKYGSLDYRNFQRLHNYIADAINDFLLSASFDIDTTSWEVLKNVTGSNQLCKETQIKKVLEIVSEKLGEVNLNLHGVTNIHIDINPDSKENIEVVEKTLIIKTTNMLLAHAFMTYAHCKCLNDSGEIIYNGVIDNDG